MKILLLDLDTLRPDHLGCYGYSRNTSPNIDKIAEQGVRFNNYYCSDAPCLPSRASLMTGRFGIHTGVVGHGGTAADQRIEGERRAMSDANSRDNLPSLIRKYGYHTTLISSFAERHGAWWFYAGFNEIYNVGKRGFESAEEITPKVLKWIDENRDKENWFLHVNYWDAHTPYRAPKEFGNPFENEPMPECDWITDEVLEKHKRKIGPHSASELSMYDNQAPSVFPRMLGEITNQKELKETIDGYDCGIKYMDGYIGEILKALEDNNMIDDVAIIVTADHGENMGELGIYGEHATADYPNCRIPMIIKWPNCQKSSQDNALHYNLDLIPTIKDLLGEPIAGRVNSKITGKVSPPKWDGVSYAKTLLSGEEEGRDYLVISQCAHTCQRGVRFGDWMYIHTYHDGYHLFDDEMLFDLKNDPHEQYNLAEKYPEVCNEAVYKLHKWHKQMMETNSYQIDPLWTVIAEGGPFHAKGHLKEYCERLEETGRGYGIEELKRRHQREFE